MKRVVVTGLGIISSIGNNIKEVENSLRNLTSGIEVNEVNKEIGLRSHVSGNIKDIELKDLIDRKIYRFMGEAAAYGYLSSIQAIEDAGLKAEDISNHRTGLIMGSGGASSEDQIESADILRSKGLKRIGPYRVTRAMGSTVSACLATSLGIKGINYSISSACSTSAHCIGSGMEQIQLNKQDVVIVGGAEAEHWGMTSLFDAMGALSTKYNDAPKSASRAFDANRDGFVIAAGGGAIILEELEHAKKRGANIYAELTGYGATSDGEDMVSPSGEGAYRCMELAWDMTERKKIDYINAHGTSTPVGDVAEIEAISKLFGEGNMPFISSTKSLTGHSLGAAGVHESIFSLIMLKGGFLTSSVNIEQLDERLTESSILLKNKDIKVSRVLSNSFGFGGTNASLIFEDIN
ncbi:MAG: beta-ketoacyl-[acyl-carrier-protein] synthase I [Gammaproteobacteria bacterium]|nr:beta-ketoacyl-[acyl-carrier-protein] synthase I [Gammaproteobacteria bacterium]|tara:strand:+ start:3900 stop:5120 length:1221 start_codon:yes stop_codon:yes gene_type:complete